MEERNKMNTKRMSKLAALFTVLALVLSTIAVPGTRAYADYEATVPTAKIYGYIDAYEINPGETIDVSIPVRVGNYTIKTPVISLDLSGTPLELVSDFTFTRDDVDENTILTMLSVAKVTYVNFKLKCSETARKATYSNIGMHFTCTDSFNDYTTIDLEQPCPFTVKVVSEKELPAVKVIKAEYPDVVNANDKFTISLNLQNKGGLTAENVKVAIKGATSAGFLPEVLYGTVEAGDMAVGDSYTADFEYTAVDSLYTGIQTVTAEVTFELDGTTYTETADINIQTKAKEEEKKEAEEKEEEKKETITGTVKLTDASYSKTVKKGDKLTVKATYENQANEAVSSVSVKISGYDGAGFVPTFYYSTENFGNMQVGDKKTATFTFNVTDELTAGTKSLDLTVTYTSNFGNVYTETATIYVTANVPKEETTTVTEPQVQNSMPKLLITDYSLGTDKLMAGSEFDFGFSVKNTHSSVDAENIRVTISCADGTFSIIEGSASFLIESLKAGETLECSMPLKVRNDAATGGYDISIAFEYEYAAKDENKNNITKTGSQTETLKIPVYSNDRPMVSNVNVGYWDLPSYGELTTMSFEFYNMGMSPLYNVTATVEGDFESSNSMLMIGNVQAGSGQSYEMDVTPIVGYFGSGVLHISYEDVNGNVSTVDTEFSSDINGGPTDDSGTGYDDSGDYSGDWGDIDYEDYGEDADDSTGMTVWGYVAIGFGAVAVVAAVVVIIIVVSKKKKGAIDFDEDD